MTRESCFSTALVPPRSHSASHCHGQAAQMEAATVARGRWHRHCAHLAVVAAVYWLQQMLIDAHDDASHQATAKSRKPHAVLRTLCDRDVLSLFPPRARHKLAGVHSSMHAAIATLPDPWLAHQRSTGRLRTCPQCKLQLWTDDFAWPGSDKPRSICNMCKDTLMDAHNCNDWAALRQALS